MSLFLQLTNMYTYYPICKRWEKKNYQITKKVIEYQSIVILCGCFQLKLLKKYILYNWKLKPDQNKEFSWAGLKTSCILFLKLISAIFYQIFIFYLIKMFFISSKKLFSFSIYSNFCIFFPSFPHFSDLKGQIEVK